MTDAPLPPANPSRKAILIMTAGAIVAAVVVLFGAILPAEYAIDPLGIGKVTGLSRLWAPKEVEAPAARAGQAAAHEYAAPYRSDIVEIPLAVSGDPQRGDELEYKVRMKTGGTIVYSWIAEGPPPDEFYYDFHGHTTPPGGQKQMTVSTYKQAVGVSQNGALTAQFDGVHGWYFQNQALRPAKVRLRISGFYELIPPGEVGNEAGISPK